MENLYLLVDDFQFRVVLGNEIHHFRQGLIDMLIVVADAGYTQSSKLP